MSRILGGKCKKVRVPFGPPLGPLWAAKDPCDSRNLQERNSAVALFVSPLKPVPPSPSFSVTL